MDVWRTKTIEQTDGTMKTETTLDRHLGATPLLSANILLPEGLCKESFIDSKGNCVAVQLAALLKSPLDRIEQDIDQLYSLFKHQLTCLLCGIKVKTSVAHISG